MSEEDKGKQAATEDGAAAAAAPEPDPAADRDPVPTTASEPADAEPASEPQVTADPVGEPDRGARRLAAAALWLALLALIAGAGLAAGAWMRHQQLLQQESLTAERFAAQDQEQTRQQQQLAAIGSRTEALDAALQQQQADGRRAQLQRTDLERRLGESEAALSRLSKLIQGGRETWQMGEVEHLLLVANDRAQLHADADGAMRALQVADERIARLGDPRLLPVREKIAAELQALRATERVDLQALALRLGSLAESAARLPLQAAPEPEFVPRRPARDAPPDARSWEKFVAAMQNALFSLVSVRRDEAGHEPLMAPEQSYFLYQNLRLQLEAARLAVLRRDTANLRASLRSAESWLHQYFAVERPAVQAALRTLGELQGQNLNPALPDLSGSLLALRRVLESE